MRFRWVAFITLWTMFVGPVFDAPLGSPNANPDPKPVRPAKIKPKLER